MKLHIIAASVTAGCIASTVFAQSSAGSAPPRTKVAPHEVTLAPNLRPTHTAFVGGSDSCSSPDVITGTGAFQFNNSAATTGAEGQSNSACNFFGATGIANDVWFVWTSIGTGNITLSLCGGTSMDSKVAVYAGAGCPGGAPLACNDDSCSLQSQLTFFVTNGSQYTIQLGNFPGATGSSGTFSFLVCCGPSLCVPDSATAAPCPCTSGSAPVHGCNNSDNTGGAFLSVAGTQSLANDSVVFTCSGERASALSIVLQGDVVIPGTTFGQGILCISGNLLRLYVEHAVSGTITAPSGAEPSVSARSAALGDVLSVGATRFHQVYYRDPIVHRPCDRSSATFNTSQGQWITWYP